MWADMLQSMPLKIDNRLLLQVLIQAYFLKCSARKLNLPILIFLIRPHSVAENVETGKYFFILLLLRAEL